MPLMHYCNPASPCLTSVLHLIKGCISSCQRTVTINFAFRSAWGVKDLNLY